jgi:hypothetical protein
MTQVSLILIPLWVAALATAGIAVWRGPRPITRDFVIDRLLRYRLVSCSQNAIWSFQIKYLAPLIILHQSPKNCNTFPLVSNGSKAVTAPPRDIDAT